MEFDLDMFSLPETPYTLTSSLLALSPISDIDNEFDPEALPDLDANPPPSPPTPPSVQIHPLPLFCSTCGSSVVSPLPSSVALYSLAVAMPPRRAPTATRQTRSNTTDPTASDQPSTAAPLPPKTRGQKRKAPAVNDSENVDVAVAANPPPAQPQPTIPTTAVTANTRAKGKSNSNSNTTIPNSAAHTIASTAAPAITPLVPAPAHATAVVAATAPTAPTPAAPDVTLSLPISPSDLDQHAKPANQLGAPIANAPAAVPANPAEQQGETDGKQVSYFQQVPD